MFGLVLSIGMTLSMIACPTGAADITIHWTIPADDGSDCLTGDPVGYDLIWGLDSTLIVTADVSEGWQDAAGVTVIRSTPSGVCADTEDHTLTGLPGNVDIFVSIKYYDEVGNYAPLGNICRRYTADEIAPAAVWDIF